MALDNVDVTTIQEVSTYRLGRPYMDSLIVTYPLLAIIYSGLTIFALVVGIIGNVCLLATLFKHRKLQKVGRTFMINLAFADLCVAAVADPLCLIAVFEGEEYFMERQVLCEFIASFCLTACFCAFLSLSCLTISRMFFICYNETYYTLFGGKRTMFFCVACWILGFCFEVGNFLGWGDHTYDQKNHSCIWDRTKSQSYTYFVAFGLIMGPLTMMFFSNLKIFWAIYSTKSTLINVTKGDEKSNSSVWRETIKASKSLFIVFTAFTVLWMPYTIIIVVDVFDDIVAMPVHLFVTMLAHAHSSVNFSIYVTSNKRFRKAFLSTMCCKPEEIISSSQGNTTMLRNTNSSTLPVNP